MKSADPVSPAVARFFAHQANQARQDLEAEALAQRWPMSLNVRGVIIETALNLCGLKVTSEGAVKKIEDVPLPKPRIRLGAMRVIASYDRLSLQQRKADLVENPTDEEPVHPLVEPAEMSPEVATEILTLLENAPPAPAPARAPGPKAAVMEPNGKWRKRSDLELARRAFRQRWPLSMAMRGQIIVSALSLCGYAVTCEGQVEPITPSDDVPTPKHRIVLAALRVLAAYDRLSIEERRIELRIKPSKTKRANRPDIDPDTAAKIYELIESDSKRSEHQQK
jgi:hypothetical protein